MAIKEAVQHDVRRTFGVLWVLGVIALVFYLLWSGYVTLVRPITKPNPTTTQNAEKIENIYQYQNKKVFGLGITLWGLDIGIMKYDYPKKPCITNTTVEK